MAEVELADESKQEDQVMAGTSEAGAVDTTNTDDEKSPHQQQLPTETESRDQDASGLPDGKQSEHGPTTLENEVKSEQKHRAENQDVASGHGSKRRGGKARGHGHRKHHAKKRPPTTGSDVLGAIPKVKEGVPGRGGVGAQVHRYEDPFEEIAHPIFRRADTDNDGYLATDEFWRIFRSQQLNLALTDEEMHRLEDEADLDKDGKIGYEECIPVLRKVLVTVYQIQDKSPFEWIELVSEGGESLWFSKSTGQTRYMPPQGYETTHQRDLFEDVIYEVFIAADTAQVGYLSRDQLVQLLQSETLALHLTDDDIAGIVQELPGYAVGRITYDEFVPVAKQLIMMSYQAKDPSASEWVQLSSSRFGLFWFNKRTGESRSQPPQELVMLQQQLQEQREEEIAFVRQAVEELDAVKYGLEQEQIRGQALEGELTHMAQQLDETGRALDEANEQKSQYSAELGMKDTKIAELNAAIQQLETQVSSLAPLRDELQNTKSTLHAAEQTVSKRDGVIAEREQTIQQLREQVNDLTAKLENANSLIASTSGSLACVTKELSEERSKSKTLQKEIQFIPVLQEELERSQDQLVKLQKSFDEKSTALSQTRKTMRNIRERNAELEKELGNMAELRDKLHQARCETRTVKQFLAGKSTLVQERTRELEELKQRQSNMEEKDSRRARILADVLERTARLYQQQVSAIPKQWQQIQEQQTPMIGQPVFRQRESLTRSSSCPSFIPESVCGPTEGIFPVASPRQQRTIQYADGFSVTRTAKKSQHFKSQKTTIPRLPPVDLGLTVSRKDPFKPISPLDLKESRAAADAAVPSEYRFLRQMSTLEPSRREGTSVLMPGQAQAMFHDDSVAADLKVGDRVLVRLKRNDFEIEPRTFSGQVKFIGAVDSAYVDHRVYAGVKLDDPVGQHDGIVKGKRYFTCPPNHGVMVRIQDIVAFLKPKSLVYKSVQRRPQQPVM